jgi:hypothetical protein
MKSLVCEECDLSVVAYGVFAIFIIDGDYSYYRELSKDELIDRRIKLNGF